MQPDPALCSPQVHIYRERPVESTHLPASLPRHMVLLPSSVTGLRDAAGHRQARCTVEMTGVTDSLPLCSGCWGSTHPVPREGLYVETVSWPARLPSSVSRKSHPLPSILSDTLRSHKLSLDLGHRPQAPLSLHLSP